MKHLGDVQVTDFRGCQCNKRLKNMEVDSKYRVMVEFEDGTRAVGSCVIGCDGSRSRVREYLCGERARPVDTGTTMINHVASYTAEQARLLRMYHPISQLAFSHDRCAVLLAGKIQTICPKLNPGGGG